MVIVYILLVVIILMLVGIYSSISHLEVNIVENDINIGKVKERLNEIFPKNEVHDYDV